MDGLITRRDRRRARDSINNAMKGGRFMKASVCIWCYTTEILEAHHPDYRKPMEIWTMCKTCHERLHKDEDEKAALLLNGELPYEDWE